MTFVKNMEFTQLLFRGFGVACLGVVLTIMAGCRNDPPPTISIVCLGNGFGGADCSLPNGERKYLAPSELKNFWMTTQTDMKNFSSWCYQTNGKNVEQQMQNIITYIKGDEWTN